MKRFFRVRYLLVVVIALIVATGVLGFAASNTVQKSSAGDGENTISGYAIKNIAYTLNATDPTYIDAVTFDVSGGAGQPVHVKAALVDGGSFYTCSTGSTVAPWAYSCPTTSPTVTVKAADKLRVVAAQ